MTVTVQYLNRRKQRKQEVSYYRYCSGNTVIVIEHSTDVMKLADYIIDIDPDGGTKGGEVVCTGTPNEMVEHGTTITEKYLRK